jgi:hypothetical protein
MAVPGAIDVEGAPKAGESGGGETVLLALPHEPRFLPVARILVGGLAARLDLPFESLDDLQLAVESVLAEDAYRAGEQVTIEVTILDRSLSVLIGPLQTARLQADLERQDDAFGLGLLLTVVVDRIGFETREDATWLRLEKSVPLAAAR